MQGPWSLVHGTHYQGQTRSRRDSMKDYVLFLPSHLHLRLSPFPIRISNGDLKRRCDGRLLAVLTVSLLLIHRLRDFKSHTLPLFY
jgi:hypothetical protein